MNSLPRPAGSTRLHELDSLRGIAALGVVLWHYRQHFHADPLVQLARPFYTGGFLFVDFFFVLSGYVISRAYWNAWRQSNLWRNIWARIARLYPLHLLTLLVTVALLAALPPGANDVDFRQPANDARHFVLNLLLLNQVGLQEGWSFNLPAWSISTEFVINVLFLAGIAIPARARLVAGGLLAVMAAVLFMVIRPPVIAGQLAFGFIDVNLFRCALGFGAGILVYLTVHRWGAGRRLSALPRLSDALGMASLVALIALMAATHRHPPVSHYLVSILAATGCVLFVPFGPALRRVLGMRWLVYLGDISYSTYLVHYPLQLGLYVLAVSGSLELNYQSPATLLAYLAAVLAVSAVTHRLVELRWQAKLLAWVPQNADARHRASVG